MSDGGGGVREAGLVRRSGAVSLSLTSASYLSATRLGLVSRAAP
ncbi:hypothetical protein ABZX85_46805 [Streptomyces sp. NPDC004539]